MEVISRTIFPRVFTRSMSRNISTVTHKTYQLIQELTSRSQPLVDLYRRHQGPPFNRPGFKPPSTPLPGLPALPHGDEEREEGAWLLAEHRAYTGLAHYLGLVLEEQRQLNPGQARLLEELTFFAVNIRGLTVNLELLLSGLGPGLAPHGQPWHSRSAGLAGSDWEKKVRGLEVCTRCVRWLRASGEGFAGLVAKCS